TIRAGSLPTEQMEDCGHLTSSTETVERVAEPSAEEFRRRYVAPGRPVVITGAMESWPARHKWSFKYFRANFKDRTLPVARVDDRGVVEYAKSGFAFDERMRFGAFLD